MYLDTRDNKLYEVNGSHCSCYGLEEQWNPDEVNLDSLEHRLTEGRFGYDCDDNNKFGDQLKSIIKLLKDY